MTKIRITIELDDDIWGLSDAVDEGCSMEHMRDVAMEDVGTFVECAKFIAVEKIEPHGKEKNDDRY